MVLKPGAEETAKKVFEKWQLDFAVIGTLTDTGRMVLRHGGKIVGDLPIDPLAEASPEYDREWTKTPKPKPLTPKLLPSQLPNLLQYLLIQKPRIGLLVMIGLARMT